MNKFLRRFSIFLMLLVFGQMCVIAQGRMVTVIPSGKVLEVDLGAGRPPARIPLSTREPYGFWTSNVGRIKGWTLPAGHLPIQVMNFQARLVDDKAELKVSVFSGKRFRENDDLIATYVVGEGESAVISEVSKYGVSPIKIKLGLVNASIANVPAVVNRTQSLRVEVEPTVATLPTFIARVTNRSSKPVAGFLWHTMAGDRFNLSAMPHAQYGKPLILPKQEYEVPLRTGDSDSVVEGLTLHLDAVVFTDGTFEGDTQAAANFKAFWYGRKDALIQMLPVLKEVSGPIASRPNATGIIEKLERGKRDISPELLAAFSREFPDDANMRGSGDGRFRAATDAVYNEIIGALRSLDKAAIGRSDADVSQALTKLTKHFQEWLDRLSN